jgi:SPP1 gp7 family putative phage head morphogenesis protein
MPPTKPTFGPTQRLQRLYEQGIRQITGRVLLRKEPEQSFSEWIAALQRRSQEPDIEAASTLLASRMVSQISAKNMKTWRQAAAKSQRSAMLYRLLQQEMQGPTGLRVQQIVRENARLISSLPIEAATKFAEEIEKAQQAGARASTLDKMARARFPELLRSRVHLISRTETSKCSSALTQARAEHLNLPAYIWRTSKDARVRDSHAKMDGVVCFWADPISPEALAGEKSYGPYNCGDTFNDRCYPEVVLTLDDISFPARVATKGRIITMTKQQFKQQFAVQELEAA